MWHMEEAMFCVCLYGTRCSVLAVECAVSCMKLVQSREHCMYNMSDIGMSYIRVFLCPLCFILVDFGTPFFHLHILLCDLNT